MSRVFRFAAALFVLALAASCGRGGSAASLSSPVARQPIDELIAANRDCLQYPIETRADGSEVWRADYVFLSLIDKDTNKPPRGPNGEVLGDRLLPSQALAFMKAHPELESHTDWAVQLSRTLQVAKDGRELSRSEPVFMNDGFDLDSLLALDAAARTAR